MANVRKLIDFLQDGNVADFNKERPEALDLFGADLAELDLSSIDLRRVKMAKADLSGVKLFGANVEGADLEGVDLTDAAFGDSTVKGASFRDANLESVEASGNFIDCDFTGSTWSGTATRGCTFTRCKFEGAEFASSYFKRHNKFQQCTPEEIFEEDEEDEITPVPKVATPDFLAPKAAPKSGAKAEVISYQVELSPEMIDSVLRFLSKEGNAEAVTSGKLSTRTFNDQLYLGFSAKDKKGPLTDWIRFELVKKTFYRSTEVQSSDYDFVTKVAVPLAKRYRGALHVLLTKKGDRKKTALHLEDGREFVPEDMDLKRFLKAIPRPIPGRPLAPGDNEDQILAEAEPLPDEDADD
jgi:uncharacterized protein YjbI with pentapeptide repeats